MYKSSARTLLLVYLFFSTAFSIGLAQQQCLDIFAIWKKTADVDPIDTLMALEQEISAISETYHKKFSKDVTMGKELGKINKLFEEVFSELGSNSSQSSSFHSKIEFLIKKINEFKSMAFILEQRQTNTNFNAAVENYKILVEGRLYELNGMDPLLQKVSFSKEVLESIFWSDQALMQRAAELIFRGLERGRKFATDKSGVIAFVNDKSVYKVKISGDVVGALRVAGFFHGLNFHIVAWANESSHNHNNSQRLTEKVNRIREIFFKTGHY